MAASYETVREMRIGEDSLAVLKGCRERRSGYVRIERAKEMEAGSSGSSFLVQMMLEAGSAMMCDGWDPICSGSPLDDVTGFGEQFATDKARYSR